MFAIDPGQGAYCYFSLLNTTMETCSWGPWGLVSSTWPDNSRLPFAYSPVFHLVQANETGQAPQLWRDATNAEAANTAAPTTIVPCPSMGLPATGTEITTTLDHWPPMKTSLVFPTQTYVYEDSSEL